MPRAYHDVRRTSHHRDAVTEFAIDYVYPSPGVQPIVVGGMGMAFFDSERVEEGWTDEKAAMYRAMELDKERLGKSEWTPAMIERHFEKRAEREKRRQERIAAKKAARKG